MIEYLKVGQLSPHPKNPRRSLGDLFELTKSIKERGIQQNLTVVPATPGYCLSCTKYIPGSGGCKEGYAGRPPCPHWDSAGNYTVVVGHRRLEAAKLAGLEAVPCLISDMDEMTQVATMLMENLQRCDLTLAESCEGMQMMLDLGGSVKDVSRLTGVSDKTVRRRTKLVQTFGGELLQSVQGRDIKLEDYEKLYKVKDEGVRGKLFQELGKSGFDWAVKSAIDNQEFSEAMTGCIELLEPVAKRAERKDFKYSEHVIVLSQWNPRMSFIESLKGAIAAMDPGKEYFFYTTDNNIALYTYRGEDDAEADAEADARVAAEDERKRRRSGLENAFSQAYALRLAFAQGFRCTKELKPAVDEMAVATVFQRYGSICEVTFADLSGIKVRQAWQDDDGENGTLFADAVKQYLARDGVAAGDALFACAYCCLDSDSYDLYDWQLHYDEDCAERSILGLLYFHLSGLGYVMSGDEGKLLDGSHELYVKPDAGGDGDDEPEDESDAEPELEDIY